MKPTATKNEEPDPFDYDDFILPEVDFAKVPGETKEKEKAEDRKQ